MCVYVGVCVCLCEKNMWLSEKGKIALQIDFHLSWFDDFSFDYTLEELFYKRLFFSSAFKENSNDEKFLCLIFNFLKLCHL